MEYDTYELTDGSTIYPLFEFEKNDNNYLVYVEKIPYDVADIIVAIEKDDALFPVDDISDIENYINNILKSL